MLGLNKSRLEIANVIGKPQRTVQREVKIGKTTIRNTLWEYIAIYSSGVSQKKYDITIKNKGKTPRIHNNKLAHHIIKMYHGNKHSPEAIVADIKNRNLSFDISICANTIRYYINHKIVCL